MRMNLHKNLTFLNNVNTIYYLLMKKARSQNSFKASSKCLDKKVLTSLIFFVLLSLYPVIKEDFR